MTARARVLLVNPRITSRRSARFPLSVLALAGSLQATCDCRIIDGNVDADYLTTLRRALIDEGFAAVGLTVMGGPQVATAIAASRVIRDASPPTPIIWGGYFPSLYTETAIGAAYVDYVIKGPGEETFAELLAAIGAGDRIHHGGRSVLRDRLAQRALPEPASLESIRGLSWKRAGAVVHNSERPIRDARSVEPLPYDLLGDPRRYLAKTFLGRRTAVHQAAVGCRFRCTFCGVASMFRGGTGLPQAHRLERDLRWLKDGIGADSIQFFDHNFFERETDMIPLLEVLGKIELPWWCYARADALLNLSESSWALVRKSRLRMAYIGAESPNDAMLKSIRKGTNSDQTLAVAELCRRHDVIPELSFMVAPPDDPEGETERTFEFIREVKRINPHSEIIVYIYTPLPASSLPQNSRARSSAGPLLDLHGNLVRFPTTPEEWTQQRWVDYACHADAPWLNDRLRRRIRNFVTVLGCRFPTAQDVRSPAWSKPVLSALASWRYKYRRYGQPWELALSKKLIRLAHPQSTGI
jgi:anaerobic magnesium-protoporphyrin IX monomethyl ester cyclase